MADQDKNPRKLSPQRGSSGRSKSPSGSSAAAKSAGKRTSANKNKKKTVTIKPPDLTADGLKIVNMSNQGMTVVPPSLLQTTNIGELCLALNNLRSLPPEMRRMTTLTKLDVSVNGIRCLDDNDFTGVPKELAELTNLVELKISECNLPTVPPAIWMLTSLKILDISRNKINELLPDIKNLVNLQKLNLQQTNITTLPPEIAYCQELEEILLWGNAIESLPETLPEMPKLRTLAVNYRSFCGVVDSYMEKLLRKGQIKSEHIPLVVFELATLEILDLENTKINNLPDIYNIDLQEFYLCKNFLNSIPPSVFNLKHLTILDLSSNLLTSVPEDIGRIHSLVKLHLNNNSIDRIPLNIEKLTNLTELNLADNKIHHLPLSIKGLHLLKRLYLERNELTSLPEEICELVSLQTLDITENKIKQLPLKIHQLHNLKVAHSYYKLKKRGLWLYKNPLVQPPPEIWKTEHPEKIYEYMKKLAIIKTENLQQQKLLVFGATQSGKTSLVNAMVHRKSMLTNGTADKTCGLQQTQWKSENNVEFMVNDFGGDDAYKMIHPFFVDAKGMVLVVYDHNMYTEETHHEAIGQWLEMLNVYCPGVVVKLVGTHLDCITDDQASLAENSEQEQERDENGNFTTAENNQGSRCQKEADNEADEASAPSETMSSKTTASEKIKQTEELVKAEVDRQMATYKKKIKDQLVSVEKTLQPLVQEPPEISSNPQYKHLLTQRKKLEFLLENPLRIMPEISLVSSNEGLEGISQFINSLELMAIDKELFPHAQRSIPDHWNRFRAMLKQQKVYYLTQEEVESAGDKFGLEDEELTDALQYLNDTGDILWFRDEPCLHNILFHKPRVLVDLLASVYRHDLDSFLDYDVNKVFMSKGNFGKEDFQIAKDIFLRNGQISRPMLNCFWFYHQLSLEGFNDLLDLLPKFKICYSIPEPDVPKGKNFGLPLMVLPWYNSDDAGSDFVEIWTKLTVEAPDNTQRLSVEYQFPLGLPDGLFEKLTSDLQFLVLTRIDWKDTVFASTENEHFIFRKTIESGGGVITISILGQDEMSMQSLIREITQMMSDLLLRTPGLIWKILAAENLWKTGALCYNFKSVQFED